MIDIEKIDTCKIGTHCEKLNRTRQELNKILSNNLDDITKPEVIRISQILDRLIVKFMEK